MPSAEIVEKFVTWALVILGWFIIGRDQDRRARRTEVRDSLKSTSQLIIQIEDAAQSYWKLTGDDPESDAAALKLKFSLKQLSGEVVALCRHDVRFGLFIPVATFRKAATGGEFEVKTRKAETRNSQRLVDICSAGLDLREGLAHAFNEVYC